MNIQPGKYEAVVESKGVRENTRLENQPLEAYATFNVNGVTIYWNGLLLTRDGNRNTKTMKCLAAMGCKDHDVIAWLKLESTKPVTLTMIEKTKANGELISVVDWINSNDSQPISDSVVDKLKAAGLGGDDLPF